MKRSTSPAAIKGLCALITSGFTIAAAHAATDISHEPTASARIQGSSEELTYRIVDGYAIFGGDIVLGRHEEIQNKGIPPMRVNSWTRDVDDRTRARQSAAVAEGAATWPNGVVPYQFGGSVSSSFRQVVQAGMDAIEAQTDIEFVQRADQGNYINIMRGSGCWSYVGMTGGAQDLSLGRGCDHEGVVIHELLHALGHFHEQSREDRDQYVTIHWDNVQSGMESNFRIQNEQNIGPYDYGSIMHYGAWAFSTNGEPTISPVRDGVTHRDLGQRQGLSDLDVAALNEIYGTSENAKPELSLRHKEAVIFNTQSYELAMRLADDQTPVDDLQITAVSGNTAVLPDSNIAVRSGSQSDEKILEMTPNSGATGTAEVTITVTDGQGLRTSDTFTLTVKDDGDGETDEYRTLASMLNDQCLTVAGDASQDGAQVELAECQETDNQQWLHDGSDRLRPRVASDKCLEVGSSPYWGSRAYISSCVEASHQQWRMDSDRLVNQQNTDMVLTTVDSGIVFAWGRSGYWGSYYSDEHKLWKWAEDEATGAPCTECEQLTGTLGGAGDNAVEPDGNYYHAASAGTHQGWLAAPDNASYILELFHWSGSQWQRVQQASAEGGSRAAISHQGESGYYAFVVRSESGSGDYRFWLQRP